MGDGLGAFEGWFGCFGGLLGGFPELLEGFCLGVGRKKELTRGIVDLYVTSYRTDIDLMHF